MNRLTLLLLLLSTGLFGQETVSLTANMTDCGQQIGVYAFKAMGLQPVTMTRASEENKFEFTLETEKPELVYVGLRPNKVVPVMIGPDEEVTINASCRNPQRAEITGSPFNGKFLALQNAIRKYKRENNILMTKMVRAETEEEKSQAIAGLKDLDSERLQLFDSLQTSDPYLAKIVALNTYLSYPHNGGKYQNELEYFGNEFFSLVDFQDTDYNTLPLVFDAFYEYTRTMLSTGLNGEILKRFFDRSLGLIPAEHGGARQLALGGIIRALEQSRSDLFGDYAKRFITNHGEAEPEIAAALQQKYAKATQFAIGKVAPDFNQQTPDGEDMKLSDFRGKYVLIDFWASWCGPCRRENPNVVKMYQKYKEKGFEILGVSLDNSRERWLGAIAQDQLTWPHVSDLKGWKNAVAQQYNITSIPRTVLIDPEGKIIAKNLRGASLEQKLIELFDGEGSGQ